MIERDSDIPYFRQLLGIIETDINNGVYRTVDKLPSESKLCERYGVSRMTVRQALNLLQQKDLVYSVHGKGTFIKLPELNHELSRVVSFEKILDTSGIKGLTRVVEFDTGVTNLSASNALGNSYFNLFLLGFAKETPVVYYESFIRNDMKARIYAEAKSLEMSQRAFSTYDIYGRLGKKIDHIDQKLHAISADRNMLRLFRQSGEQLVLIKMDSIYYDENRIPMEYKIAYYRADVYSFELKRELE